MELSIESSWQYVKWKVRDFFQLPSEIGYCLDSPEFPFAGDSYCLQLYPNGSKRYRQGTQTELNIVRLTSTFPERSVSCKLGYRWGEGEGNEYEAYSETSTLNYKFYIGRLVLEEERDIYVPDGTLTTLCCIRLKEQGTAVNLQAEEVESSDTKEDEKGLQGQSVCFSSHWWSFKMELSIESPWQHITWKIQDFFQLLKGTGCSLNSPEFRFAGDRYCLRFYPKGDRNADKADAELQLVRLTSNFPEMNVLYKAGYRWRNTHGREKDFYFCSGTLIDERYRVRLSVFNFVEGKNIFIPDGTLTILCSMHLKAQVSARSPQSEQAGNFHAEEKQEEFPGKGFVSCAIQTNVPGCVSCSIQTEVASSVIEKENPKDEEWPSLDIQDDTLLRERMKELLTKGRDHDLTICVQDKEFRAHRNILSARSPVFAMMLAHDTKENNTGTINIEDCDPESFDEFLLYVYSGRTENLTPSNALQLYYPADKYDFPVLKERCVSLLKTSLSVESICDVVLLAARHQEKGLLEVATEFFARNMKKIVVTVGWLKFLPQNPVEANELIIKSMEILNPEN